MLHRNKLHGALLVLLLLGSPPPLTLSAVKATQVARRTRSWRSSSHRSVRLRLGCCCCCCCCGGCCSCCAGGAASDAGCGAAAAAAAAAVGHRKPGRCCRCCRNAGWRPHSFVICWLLLGKPHARRCCASRQPTTLRAAAAAVGWTTDRPGRATSGAMAASVVNAAASCGVRQALVAPYSTSGRLGLKSPGWAVWPLATILWDCGS